MVGQMLLRTDPMTWSSILGKGSASPRTWVVSLQLLEAMMIWLVGGERGVADCLMTALPVALP